MTKDEAKKAMEQGKRVTHEYFTGDEWVKEGAGGYIFEDGVCCSTELFWHFRRSDEWLTGWSIFNN